MPLNKFNLIFSIDFVLIFVCWTIPYTRKIIREHRSQLLTIQSGLAFYLTELNINHSQDLFFGMKWGNFVIILVIAGIILAFIAIYFMYDEESSKIKCKDLKKELVKIQNTLSEVEQEYVNLCSDNIKTIFKDFFIHANGNGRVSLYKHQGEHFKLLGRYSNNPEYNKRGKRIYSDEEGFIALGWKKGSFELHGAPAWKNPGSEYKKFMKSRCNIDDNRINELTMKARSFYVYRFNNHDARNPHGIIVFEKMDESRINTSTIDKIFNRHEDQIINLLKSLKSLNFIN